MKPLEARLKRLEEADSRRGDGRILVVVRSIAEQARAPLRGYRSRLAPEVETIKEPGESDAALLTRAVMASPVTGGGACLLMEVRR